MPYNDTSNLRGLCECGKGAKPIKNWPMEANAVAVLLLLSFLRKKEKKRKDESGLKLKSNLVLIGSRN